MLRTDGLGWVGDARAVGMGAQQHNVYAGTAGYEGKKEARKSLISDRSPSRANKQPG